MYALISQMVKIDISKIYHAKQQKELNMAYQ